MDTQAIKQQQREQWGQAAAGWRKHDERLRRVTAPVTERLLELVGVSAGQRVLDIACGTGEPALPAAQLVGAAGFVLATDMAPEMLEVARDKAKAQGVTNVEFRLVDGEEIAVEPESFDAVTCRWGIMFMPQPLLCLEQAHKALKPGGRIAVSVWGPPDRNPFIGLPMSIVRKYYTGPPLPDPTAPGGIFAFADRSKLEFVFKQAGFRDIHIDDMELTMAQFDSGQEFWQYQLEFVGPFARLYGQLSQEAQEKAARDVIAAAPQGSPDGKVSLNGYPLFASATK